MKKEIVVINGKKFTRCRRPEALITYLDGGRVGMCMANALPSGQFGLTDFKDATPAKKHFIERENGMLYYNKCHELGYYVKWYKEI